MELQADNAVYHASVFGDALRKGSTACVVFRPGPLPVDNKQTAIDGDVYCFLAPHHSGGFDVSCYQGQQRIQCCGHGLLAAAQVIHSRTADNRFSMYSGDTELRVYRQDQQLWLAFLRRSVTTIVVPRWVVDWLPAVPLRAAIAGAEDGYLIVEVPEDFDLATWRPNFDHITANTQRAVILTQADSGEFDFRLRYFAPQYGNNEDAATGSGMRVLAEYWHLIKPRAQYKALQCSSSGGVLKARVLPGHLAISGEVTIHPVTTSFSCDKNNKTKVCSS